MIVMESSERHARVFRPGGLTTRELREPLMTLLALCFEDFLGDVVSGAVGCVLTLISLGVALTSSLLATRN